MNKNEKLNEVETLIVKALNAFDDLSEMTEKYDDYRSQLGEFYENLCEERESA